MTIVAIHQSQYLPWPPYFRKMAEADIFVVLDAVQYQKNGVQNRNRIRNRDAAFWLTVPVTGHLGDLISEKQIADPAWRVRHWKSIEMSYSGAPFWGVYAGDLEAVYAAEYTKLGEVNEQCLAFFLKHLPIKARTLRLSDMSINAAKSDLVLEICKAVGGEVYISGYGGKTYLREEDFKKSGIKIDYRESSPPRYKQFHGDFIEGLTLLDMMFNVDLSEITGYLYET